MIIQNETGKPVKRKSHPMNQTSCLVAIVEGLDLILISFLPVNSSLYMFEI
jgi:hypothetical protein